MFKISFFSAAMLLIAGSANAATYTIIDDFSTDHAEIETDISTYPSGVATTVAGPGILGGTRNMRVASRQIGNGFYTSAAVTNDVLVFSNSAIDSGVLKLTYRPNSAGFDLTSGGLASDFVFDMLTSDHRFGLLIRAIDTNNNASKIRTGPEPSASPTDFQVSFTEFEGSADLTSIKNLKFIFFNKTGNLDFVIDDITTAGATAPNPVPTPSPVPLPAGALLLTTGLGALALRKRG